MAATEIFQGVYAIGVSDNNHPATAKIVQATVTAINCPVNGKSVCIASRAGDSVYVANDALPALITTLIAAHNALQHVPPGQRTTAPAAS